MFKRNYKVRFYILCLKEYIKGGLQRLGSHLFSSWYYVDCDSVCTTGKVLKLNHLYTYEEGNHIEIVRLVDVHIEKGYLYCSLYFLSKNKIITVSQIMQKGTYLVWRLMDNKEYDEIMSRRLLHEVSQKEKLLEFDF